MSSGLSSRQPLFFGAPSPSEPGTASTACAAPTSAPRANVPEKVEPVPREVLDHIFALAYEQLHALSQAVLRGNRSASITPTVLIHEAWIKLANSPSLASQSPLHFRRIAACAMRQVLVDAARRRNAQSRGAGALRLTWDDLPEPRSSQPTDDVLALDAALTQLQATWPRAASLVEAHFFGGFNWDECAEMFGLSAATVMREWRFARAWLNQSMQS